jgi:two-component system, OmpR family, copper resistance phosphate regulon response regulator CusR
VKILVVEDDARFASVLERAIADAGWTAEIARDGIAGEHLLRTGGGDAVVLDLGLPGRSGLDLLKRLRAKGSTLPVLVLTGRDGVDDRIAGLDAGADDYVVKPCELRELMARLRALLRRGGGTGPVLRYADVELDPARGTASRAGQRLDLRPREYALLEFLLRHPEEVLTRTRIYDHVWEHDYEGISNVLEVYVRYLRTKLEAFGPRLLQTVRGRGYVMRRSDKNGENEDGDEDADGDAA